MAKHSFLSQSEQGLISVNQESITEEAGGTVQDGKKGVKSTQEGLSWALGSWSENRHHFLILPLTASMMEPGQGIEQGGS